MIAAVAPAATFPPAAASASGSRRELGSLLLRRTLQGALIGAGVGLSYFSAALPVLIDADANMFASFDAMVLRSTCNVMVLACLLTLALRFATSLPQRLAGAALAMTVTYAAMLILAGSTGGLLGAGYFEASGFDELKTRMHSLWHTTAVGILLTAYYVYWDRTHRSLQVLRAAQLAQQRAEHGVLESRLNVLRARVDPVFLFEALDAVRRLYGQRRADAERLLEDLIKYLRATLPQSREEASSMAEEVNLATTYLEVRSAISGQPFRLRADLDPALAAAFFPPRVLMPIVEAAAARARAGPAALAVRARLEGDRAHVTLEEQGCAGGETEPLLGEVAMTLRAFFGPDAQVRSRAGADGRMVTLEFLHAGSAGKDVA
jgi:hypothetical protein